MKVIKKEIRDCTFEWKENKVLIINYTHRWEKWEVMFKDYWHLVDDERAYNYILKQLRIQVKNLYAQEKLKA